MISVPPRSQQVWEPQSGRHRLDGLFEKDLAQFLPLVGVLRIPFSFLGMRRQMGFDSFGALGRQQAIDASV
jgi:hypothetical protein